MEVKNKISQGYLSERYVQQTAGLLSSYLWSGDIKMMNIHMDILKEIFNEKPLLVKSIPEKDLHRIKIISNAFKRNEIPNPWESISLPTIANDEEEVKQFTIDEYGMSDEEIGKLQEEKVKTEKDLQKIIKLTYDSINHVTEDDGDLIITCEKNLKYGRADLVARGDKTCYAIELKLKEANHKIVGQIMKYMRSIGGKIHYGLYEDVQGITIAKGYSENALLDLKTLGVKTYVYDTFNGKLTIRKV